MVFDIGSPQGELSLAVDDFGPHLLLLGWGLAPVQCSLQCSSLLCVCLSIMAHFDALSHKMLESL